MVRVVVEGFWSAYMRTISRNSFVRDTILSATRSHADYIPTAVQARLSELLPLLGDADP